MLIAQYQQLQANLHSIDNNNLKKNNPTAATGIVAGRSVKQLDGCSKESRLYQSHMISSAEDLSRINYVNSVKKSELHPHHPNHHLIQV